MPNTMHSFENSSSNVPAFLVKLWKLVEDPSCNDLIAWSDNGSSFIIRDQTRFSKELLPQYFKHNNMASFIRQLNMYDFHKVMNYEKSGLRNESDEMEFQHHFFLKGQSSLLELIKRKIPNAKVSSAPVVKSNARDILTDLSSIREKQENMDNMLLKMKKENELLWRELTSMRQKHKAQEQIIQKVIQFLVSIVQQSNQNIGVGVQRKMARMLQASPGNKGKSQVTCTIDVLRNKNPSFITVDQDKLASPLGPVIHEVTDFEHEQEENVDSPDVKSPEDKTNDGISILDDETPESECPLNSSLNSPIDTSANMEPLSIWEPLQQNSPVLNSDGCSLSESVLGIPLECISSSSNIISIPEESCDNVISLPDSTNLSLSFIPKQEMSYTSTKSDFDSMSESLHTPQIPTIHLEDICPSPVNSENNQEIVQQCNVKTNMNSTHNEHNYQLALSDNSSVVKPSMLSNDEKRCTNYFSNSDLRFHSSVSNPERRNNFTNHILNVEEELKWLQEQIASNTWNIDPNKLLGLFSTEGVPSDDAFAEEIAAQSNIKTEPNDIIGNELVQFTPSMLEVELDIGNNQFLECLNQDAQVTMGTDSQNIDDQKNFLLVDVLNDTDQVTASEAAEYLLNNGSAPKHKSPRRPKIEKLQKAKRRKIT